MRCRSDLRCNRDTRSSTVDHMKSATARVAKDSGDLPLARCSTLSTASTSITASPHAVTCSQPLQKGSNLESSTCHAKNIIKFPRPQPDNLTEIDTLVRHGHPVSTGFPSIQITPTSLLTRLFKIYQL